MSDEWFFRLARWALRLVAALLLFGATIAAYVSASSLPTDRQGAAHLAYWFAALAALVIWTVLRLTVYRHPVDDGGNVDRDKATRQRLNRQFSALLGLVVVSMSWPLISCLLLGISGGLMAAATLYPAMFLVRTRPILS
ncbi:MAG: hypothetical protein QOE83_833 [Actinomycetota bacterium]|jgi:hypothetical protein|nr:hypothetical protein [Actinomycetota bacterium]